MSFSVEQVIDWSGGRLVNGPTLGDRASAIRVTRPSPLGVSTPTDLAFFFSRAYEKEVSTAAPGILITSEPFAKALESLSLPLWRLTAVISCPDPYLALAVLSEKFAVSLSTVAHPLVQRSAQAKDIHPTAVIDPTAKIGDGVKIGPFCVIERDVVLGRGSVLYSGCTLGPGARVGEDCVFFPGVTLYEWTQVGNRVRIHAGAVIGSDGFGYAPIRQGRQVTGHQKIFHLGRVVIEDGVEIGANSCVDRSTFGETRIEQNAKLDNQVHIGHNAQVGEGSLICGGTCLAGRASLGRFAIVGGLTGIANDVHIGDGASVGAVALVTKDVAPGSTAVGNPQREFKEHFKAHALLNRLLAERGASGSHHGKSIKESDQ